MLYRNHEACLVPAFWTYTGRGKLSALLSNLQAGHRAAIVASTKKYTGEMNEATYDTFPRAKDKVSPVGVALKARRVHANSPSNRATASEESPPSFKILPSSSTSMSRSASALFKAS